MHCNYYVPTAAYQHPSLNNVRPRLIPTYTHTEIFTPQTNQNFMVRCTPTFHSTALDTEGYRYSSKDIETQKNNQTIRQKAKYLNESRQRRIAQLNTNSQPGRYKVGQWQDPAKKDLFESLKSCNVRYSRERKLADLSSNPVFGGVYMEPFINEAACQSNKLKYPQPQQNVIQASLQEKNCQNDIIEVAPIMPASCSQKPSSQQNNLLEVLGPSSGQASGAGGKKQILKPGRPHSSQTAKRLQESQKYKLSNEITLCNRGCSAGRKLAKIVALGPEPTFKIFRSK